ncbi:hypothetical protein D6774_01415 [Candidatus Woesearchaeota archaeon]|nr:MAG: hypothetical protein D6774_01415 [Candidatus Woesearchaeota archaeon]
MGEMPKPGKKEKIADFSIVYKDVFSWEWLYKTVHTWLNDEGWQAPEGGDKWKEKNFIQRNLPFGKEIWIWWRLQKKRGKYIMTYLDVEYHVLGMNDTEILHEGKKIKVQKGEVEVFIKAYIQRDPKGEISTLPWMRSKMVKNWFEKRWYKAEYDQELAKLYNDAYRLQHAIKQYFDIKGWIGEYAGKPFIPKKGF